MRLNTIERKRFRVRKKLKNVSKDRYRLSVSRSSKNIKKIYFDRGIYKYHGRVKIFAETLRKNGMDF